ncbi:FAD:protein FMN transferase [Sedimentitalea sp.]|uniref:FAD:protein FMN transferase n=1 Tax=Sedimentitalea sp. TaxID=2048915 RepID=UPI0032975512
MISRRRFLSIAAAAIATPASAAPIQWQGVALGADASLTIHASPAQADLALREVRTLLRRVEALFSLFDPASRLVALNQSGFMVDPAPEFVELLSIADHIHRVTGGAFDPTIQPLWQAVSRREDVEQARSLIGWDRVQRTAHRISLEPGQALTLNGIAQGYATDLVADTLRARGFDRVLVNIGEFSGLGGPWHLGISDPAHGMVATRMLINRAIATSSPAALEFRNGQQHILGPIGQKPLWSTVSVSAERAAIADAASTAFCLMPVNAIKDALIHLPGAPDATLVTTDGRVLSLS